MNKNLDLNSTILTFVASQVVHTFPNSMAVNTTVVRESTNNKEKRHKAPIYKIFDIVTPNTKVNKIKPVALSFKQCSYINNLRVFEKANKTTLTMSKLRSNS